MATDRTAILGRIRALQSKTTGAGCTEAEALAAAELAARLIEQYQVDLSEVEIEAEGVVGVTVANGKRRQHEAQWVAVAIAQFCDCRSWQDNKVGAGVRFTGLVSDVAMAKWLLVTVRNAMDSEFLAWRTRTMPEGNARSLRAAFTHAMAARVSQRLNALRASRAPARATSGRELMIVKTSLIETFVKAQGFAASFGSNGRTIKRHYRHDGEARAAGYRAGDGVGFGRPIEQGGAAAIAYRR